MVLLPQRNPVYTAKEVATLDWLSGGRVDLGVGVGWLEEEFRAVNVPWPQRGRRTDEYLEVLRTLWTDDTSAYEGEFYSLPPCQMFPKPVQSPVPVHIGGESDAALAGWPGPATDGTPSTGPPTTWPSRSARLDGSWPPRGAAAGRDHHRLPLLPAARRRPRRPLRRGRRGRRGGAARCPSTRTRSGPSSTPWCPSRSVPRPTVSHDRAVRPYRRGPPSLGWSTRQRKGSPHVTSRPHHRHLLGHRPGDRRGRGQAGFTTVATLRDPSKDGALRAAADAAGVDLDVRAARRDRRGVDRRRASTAWWPTTAALDVLVNNAGRGFVGTIEQVSMDEMREVMEVNFFGVVAMHQGGHAPPAGRRRPGDHRHQRRVAWSGSPSTRPTARPSSPSRASWRASPRWPPPVGVRVSVIEPAGGHRVREQRGRRRRRRSSPRPAPTRRPCRATPRTCMAEFADPQAASRPADRWPTSCSRPWSPTPPPSGTRRPLGPDVLGYKLSDHDGSAVVGMTTDWVR